MADETDILRVLAVLSTAFPNFKMAENTPEIYFQLLSDIPTDLLKAAVLQCCGEAGRAFAPSIGEIRGAVADIRRAVSGVPSSYQAWQEVMRQMVIVGSYRQPEFSHQLIAATVRTLGWRNLCLSENQVADRARFIQAYEQLEKRAEQDLMMLPQVRGYIEAHGNQLPAPTDSIKMLAEKLAK